jgi:hypothetical protein
MCNPAYPFPSPPDLPQGTDTLKAEVMQKKPHAKDAKSAKERDEERHYSSVN